MKIKIMKAAILVEQNQPLIVDEVELPELLDFGQVLVKVQYSGICGSQLGEIAGVKGHDPYLPHLLGHEGSGIVLEVGPHVRQVKKGDHVVLHWRPGNGIEALSPKYHWKGKPLNAGYVTTFNEFAIISENRMTPIPKKYPLQKAPLYGCAVTTGFGVIENNAKLKMGESIVIVGAGGVGLNIIQGACLHSANPVIAIDRIDLRLKLAKQIGATHVINNSTSTDWIDYSKKILGNQGADVVVDNTGNPEIIAQCIQLTKPQGRTILIGVPPEGDKTSLHTLQLHFGKILTGSHGGNGNPAIDIHRYMRLEELGKLELKSLITEVIALDDINQAIKDLINGSISGRCLIKMDTN